jgi:hypothetical protein
MPGSSARSRSRIQHDESARAPVRRSDLDAVVALWNQVFGYPEPRNAPPLVIAGKLAHDGLLHAHNEAGVRFWAARGYAVEPRISMGKDMSEGGRAQGV